MSNIIDEAYSDGINDCTYDFMRNCINIREVETFDLMSKLYDMCYMLGYSDTYNKLCDLLNN